MELEVLTKELNDIYKYCTENYNSDNGDILALRITGLNVRLARSASLLSWAQYYYDKAQGDEAEKLVKDQESTQIKISPTVFKQLINGRTVQEAKVLKFTERLNRTITHQIDGVRSQLSYLKSLPT